MFYWVQINRLYVVFIWNFLCEPTRKAYSTYFHQTFSSSKLLEYALQEADSKVCYHFPHTICLLRPTQILEISIAIHCMYNLVVHEILQATIKDSFDETHIFILQNPSFHLLLTWLCCSYESKKERCLKRIASARRFGFYCYKLMRHCDWMWHMYQLLLIINSSNLFSFSINRKF